jgi:hypothetical protein
MPRIEIPPPGRAMAFSDLSAALVARVRTYLPSPKAVHKGHRLAVIGHGGLKAHRSESASFSIVFKPASGGMVTLPSMNDDRRDEFTVGNLAKSIAGLFERALRPRSGRRRSDGL